MTSVRYYYEAAWNPWHPSHDRTPVVEAPTGITFHGPGAPEGPSEQQRAYWNLHHWDRHPAGGHFAPARGARGDRARHPRDVQGAALVNWYHAVTFPCLRRSALCLASAPPFSDADFQSDEHIEDEAVESDLDNDIPGIERYALGFYGADYPIDALHKRLHTAAEGTPGDIEIPPFQRGYVWKKPQADRFIESLLLGLPVPGIFLTQDPETKRQQIIDGVQRLLTIKRFIDGDSGKLQGVHRDFEGKRYKDLSPADTREFHDRIIHATIVRQDKA